MALLFLESWDHLSTATIADKWTNYVAGVIGAGLHGNGCVDPNLRMGLVFGSDTVILGGAFYFSDLGEAIFSLADSIVTTQHVVMVQQDGSIRAYRFTGTQQEILLTPPDTIKTGQWYYIEWKTTVDAAAGTAEVRVNGGVVATAAAVNNTGVTYTGLLRSFTLGSAAGGFTSDDLYVLDGTAGNASTYFGHNWDDYLGQIEIIVKVPNGDPDAGFLTGWTPFPAAPNWENVNEAAPDDDTTYNYAPAGTTPSDILNLQDLLPTEDVLGVQLLVNSKRTEEGAAVLAYLLRQAGVTYQGPSVWIGSTYGYYHRTPLEVSPGGAEWTKVIWDALRGGYVRVS